MSRRTERIGRLMQQTIGHILLRELSDPRIDTARTSVTRVRVQEDLLRAKVYVSVMGTEGQQRRAVEALNHAAGRIRMRLRSEIQLRHMPVLEFLSDERFKGTLRTWEIIREAMDEVRADEARRAEASAPEGASSETTPQPE